MPVALACRRASRLAILALRRRGRAGVPWRGRVTVSSTWPHAGILGVAGASAALRPAGGIVMSPCQRLWGVDIASVSVCRACVAVAACCCSWRGQTPAGVLWQGPRHVGVSATEALWHSGRLCVLPCQRPCYVGFAAVGACRRASVPWHGCVSVSLAWRRRSVESAAAATGPRRVRHSGGGAVTDTQPLRQSGGGGAAEAEGRRRRRYGTGNLGSTEHLRRIHGNGAVAAEPWRRSRGGRSLEGRR